MKRTLTILLVTGAALVGAVPAQADLRIESFTTQSSTSLAGAHPDVSTSFSFALKPNGKVDGTLRDLLVELPAGLLGNPNAATACSRARFQAPVLPGVQNCPASSQVGTARFTLQSFFGPSIQTAAVINLEAGPDEPALLGMSLSVANVYITFGSRTTSDYGLQTVIRNIPPGTPVMASTLTLWGVPADHNGSSDRKPFMTNPTACPAEPPVTILHATSYEKPDQTEVASSQAVVPPSTTPGPTTGCDTVEFTPTIKVTPDTTQADVPTGVEVELAVPQNSDPDGRATSHLRGAKVMLPPGLGISPGAGDGLQACTDEQLGAGSDADPTCPDASRVGSVTIDVPLLNAPIDGDIFLGSPTATNPFRVFLVGKGSGLVIKLRGNVSPDPGTGQLSTTFADNPQVPFTRFILRFKGGPRAILANPRTCGPALTTSVLSPWSGGPDATPTSVFDVTGCTGGFAPTFVAGATNSRAGEDTSFSLTLRRADGEPELSSLRFSMPAGLLGRLASVPMCPQDAAVAGTCDESSRVGNASVSAGSGSQPLTLPGRVYLAAPAHAGDVATLAIVVRAVAGPIDLGTVVVQSAIRLRPSDSGLDIVSDPLPAVLGGIPLRLRAIGVDIDRPGFLFNPTSCAPLKIAGTILAATGDTADVSAPFQARGCAALPLRPKLTARLGGETKRRGHPSFTATITQPEGDAHLRSTAVTLPSQLGIDLATASTSTCTPAAFAADKCPAASRIGSATAVTPVLAAPLKGPAYLIQAAGFPKLVVQLRGQVALDLEGAIAPDSRGRLVTTFAAIPDVPISSFQLVVNGGKRAPLLTSAALCSASPAARVTFVGHNGKRIDQRVTVPVAKCPKAKKRTAKSKKRAAKRVKRAASRR